MKAAQEDEYVAFVAGRAKALYRSAYVLAAGDAHLAEDLVQEALGKVYVHWRKVARADSPAAYAQTVLVRTFLSLRRRMSTGERPTGSLPEGSAPEPDSALRVTLLDALAQLPPRDRAVLLLRFWEDRSVEETAGMLRMSSSAVRSRSTRALAKARTLLGDSLSDLVSL